MKPVLKKKMQWAGVFYGLAGGLAFAIFTWGVDGFLLASAHGAYPWAKFIPGLFICALSGSLAGWLTIRFQNNILGIVLWLSLALLYSRLIVWLPIRVVPFIIKFFNGALGEYLKYPYYKSLDQTQWFGFVILAIAAIICGLLENILIEQSFFSSGTYAIAIPLVVCFLCFSLIGNAADSLLNQNIRKPLQEVDNLLQFALDNIDKEVPGDIARSMHLGAVNPIKELLPRERRLILSNFDESMGQVDILVDFRGIWAKCTTIYNQVTFCKPALEIQWIRLSNQMKMEARFNTKVFFGN
ncbi:MAG: Uncharacterized protein FD147_1359 [Chloroflexi bacterium]|nr:MAG: Uncharacterized protein FD147_1359 [Chloroflexota bacterium]MBA4374926.1 hypothetical protein [Anaerolinea sp.]